MIKAIIFDAEGVVVDTENIWDKTQQTFLTRRDIEYDRDKLKPLLTGKSVADGTLILKKIYGLHGNIQLLINERLNLTRELFEKEVCFISGFIHFYNKIRYKYKICIATALDDNLLKIIDSSLNLSKFFKERIYSISKVNYLSKPNPALFIYAAMQLGVPPSDCVVIEDSPNGVKAAKKAGMACIALVGTHAKKELTLADRIVDSYKDLENLNIF